MSFQDEFAFTNGMKINMINCSYEVVADGNRERIDTSQWMMPAGNIVFVGGAGWWPRSQGGLAGGLSIWAHQSEPDRRAPSVGYQIPRPDTTNYPVKAPLSHIIPETLDNLSLNNKSNFKVQKVSGTGCNGPLDGRLIWTSNQILMFTPDQQFEGNATYEVTFTQGGIKDAVGNGISGFAYKFSTGPGIVPGRCSNEPLINTNGGISPSPTVVPTPTQTSTPTATRTTAPTTISATVTPNAPTRTPTPTQTSTPTLTSIPQTAPRITSISGLPGTPVTLHSTLTMEINSEGGATPFEYQWEIGNQIVLPYGSQNKRLSRTFSSLGTFTIKAFIRDAIGKVDVYESSIVVVQSPLSIQNTSKSSPIILDKNSGELWANNIDDDSVSVIKTADLRKIAEIKICKKPDSIAIAPDGTKWLSCSGDDRLAQLDSSADTTPSFITLPYGSRPKGIVIQEGGKGIMYVAAEGSGSLLRVDLSARIITHKVTLGGTPHALALNGSTKRLFVTSFISSMDEGGTVWRISVEDGLPLGNAQRIALSPDTTTIPSSSAAPGIPNYLADIAINPQSGDVWVVGNKDNVRSTDSKSHDRMIRSLLSILDPGSGERLNQSTESSLSNS